MQKPLYIRIKGGNLVFILLWSCMHAFLGGLVFRLCELTPVFCPLLLECLFANCFTNKLVS